MIISLTLTSILEINKFKDHTNNYICWALLAQYNVRQTAGQSLVNPLVSHQSESQEIPEIRATFYPRSSPTANLLQLKGSHAKSMMFVP
jgi:hypothetical protein